MRVLLKSYRTYTEAIFHVDRLADEGISAVAIQACDPAPYHPNALSAVWLEDGSEWEDGQVRATVEGVLAKPGLGPEEEDWIADMEPLETEVNPDNTRGALITLALFGALIVAGAILRWWWIYDRWRSYTH